MTRHRAVAGPYGVRAVEIDTHRADPTSQRLCPICDEPLFNSILDYPEAYHCNSHHTVEECAGKQKLWIRFLKWVVS